MAVSLAGKTAIVTGAGSGINLAFTGHLLARQCNVLLADLSLRPEAEDLVHRHSSRTKLSHGRAVFQKTDVRAWKDLDGMFERAKQEFGGQVEVVCPGAGVYEPTWSSFWHPPGSPGSKDDRQGNHYASLDINLTHPIRTTQLAIQHFLSGRSSSSSSSTTTTTPGQQPPKLNIVHISSIAGQRTPMPAAIYNATKHGINGFVRSLALLDKSLGVRVTCVAPGVIKTPLWTDNPDKMRLIAKGDEWVTPEEVADTMGALVGADEVEVQAVGGEEGERRVKVEGGLVVEICKGRRRVVLQYGDPGPEGRAGNTVGGMDAEEGSILERLGRDGF